VTDRGRRPLWLLVSAAWLAPAALAMLKEYARGLAGGVDCGEIDGPSFQSQV
jgi:hypothetical protein